MQLRFIAKDPESGKDGCPSVFVDEDNADLVLQGLKADAQTHAGCLTVGPIPGHEAVIRIPARMVPTLREACDAAERAQLH
ncbi:hypothetical protein QMK19_28445 [Streptomyces sp. H10-C2]|uniref:hypothetical protein n=1 Tax=unclassified Streptomyces TaxID=2593676 RepID=UPI0024BA88DA|nr:MULTISPECIES: hypothetical protein [unclassified Streptomyces]MDJ0344031.1 hypothetical protein [Streptomyces sp. PH10-H1]MDJ0373478.1 hypothetical protein [Streptomyces sp. H10-C2]